MRNGRQVIKCAFTETVHVCGDYMFTFVIRAIFHVSRQTKVPQLHTVHSGHQDVPRSDVPEEEKETK